MTFKFTYLDSSRSAAAAAALRKAGFNVSSNIQSAFPMLYTAERVVHINSFLNPQQKEQCVDIVSRATGIPNGILRYDRY